MIGAIGSLAEPGGFFPVLAGTQPSLSRYTKVAIQAEVFYPTLIDRPLYRFDGAGES
jgi:hypothetical protein